MIEFVGLVIIIILVAMFAGAALTGIGYIGLGIYAFFAGILRLLGIGK